MGQRGAHETLYTIIGAFVRRRRWSQAELGREAGVSSAAVRKHLVKMKEDGFPLEEEKQHPHIVWRMRPGWHPGILPFNEEDLPDLLRVIARSPQCAAKERVLDIIHKRLPLKTAAPSFSAAVHVPEISSDEDQWVNLFEDAAERHVAVRIHYSSASRREDGDRYVSPHSVETGDKPRFLATCHNSGALKWFRISRVSNARLDPKTPYRDATPEKIDAVLKETVGGFHAEGPSVRCAFFVRQPEAAWVRGNLLRGMTHESVADGIRVTIDTAAVSKVAQFVVQLGGAARPETRELAAKVQAIALGALEGARLSSDVEST